MADSLDLVAAKRLLDAAKAAGFRFQRVAAGPDGPLLGVREGIDYRDEIYLGGFGERCHASRARRSSLIVPGGPPVTERVEGDALTVLHTVVSDWAYLTPVDGWLKPPPSSSGRPVALLGPDGTG